MYTHLQTRTALLFTQSKLLYSYLLVAFPEVQVIGSFLICPKTFFPYSSWSQSCWSLNSLNPSPGLQFPCLVYKFFDIVPSNPPISGMTFSSMPFLRFFFDSPLLISKYLSRFSYPSISRCDLLVQRSRLFEKSSCNRQQGLMFMPGLHGLFSSENPREYVSLLPRCILACSMW